MRVILADDLSHDRRALAVGPVGLQSEVVHRVEHAPVDRLKPSRTSGRARETITLIAYERKESFISSSMEWGRMFPEKVSSIQVLHLSRVLLDKCFARLDLVAHERGEELVCDRGRLDRDLQERPV